MREAKESKDRRKEGKTRGREGRRGETREGRVSRKGKERSEDAGCRTERKETAGMEGGGDTRSKNVVEATEEEAKKGKKRRMNQRGEGEDGL